MSLLSLPSQAMWQGLTKTLYGQFIERHEPLYPPYLDSQGECWGWSCQWFLQEIFNPERPLTQFVNIIERSKYQPDRTPEEDQKIVKEVWSAVQNSQEYHERTNNVIGDIDKGLLRERFDIKVKNFVSIDDPSSVVESFLSEQFQTDSPYKILSSSCYDDQGKGDGSHAVALWRQDHNRYVIYDPNGKPVVTHDPMGCLKGIFPELFLEDKSVLSEKPYFIVHDLTVKNPDIFPFKDPVSSWTFSKDEFSSFIERKMLPTETMILRNSENPEEILGSVYKVSQKQCVMTCPKIVNGKSVDHSVLIPITKSIQFFEGPFSSLTAELSPDLETYDYFHKHPTNTYLIVDRSSETGAGFHMNKWRGWWKLGTYGPLTPEAKKIAHDPVFNSLQNFKKHPLDEIGCFYFIGHMIGFSNGFFNPFTENGLWSEGLYSKDENTKYWRDDLPDSTNEYGVVKYDMLYFCDLILKYEEFYDLLAVYLKDNNDISIEGSWDFHHFKVTSDMVHWYANYIHNYRTFREDCKKIEKNDDNLDKIKDIKAKNKAKLEEMDGEKNALSEKINQHIQSLGSLLSTEQKTQADEKRYLAKLINEVPPAVSQ